MQHRDALKARPKPRAALPPDPQRQRNFRHENKRGFPARQRVLHRAQVHFRLAAARDAVQKLHAKFAQFKPRADGAERALLGFIQRMRRR